MDQLILDLSPSSAVYPSAMYDLSKIGGKAYNLLQLSALNLTIPDSWIIPTNEYIVHTSQPTIWDAIEELSNDNSVGSLLRVQDLIFATPIRSELADSLNDIYVSHNMGQRSTLFAIRSSANVEDRQHHSFAGVFSSTLNLGNTTELRNAVKSCWSSVWSYRAATYGRHVAISPKSVQMAVLIQKMVCARVAGVVFTCDPVTLNTDTIVIEATAQQGNKVVSGHISPEFYKLSSETGTILMHSSMNSDKAVLSADDLDWIWKMVKSITKHFSDAQEIEWAIDLSDTGYILQTRSITTVSVSSK